MKHAAERPFAELEMTARRLSMRTLSNRYRMVASISESSTAPSCFLRCLVSRRPSGKVADRHAVYADR